MYQGLSEVELFGDFLVYKLKKIVDANLFSAQFSKIISHYIRLVITLMYYNRLRAFTVDNFAFLFKCMLAGRSSDSLTVGTLRVIFYVSLSTSELR